MDFPYIPMSASEEPPARFNYDESTSLSMNCDINLNLLNAIVYPTKEPGWTITYEKPLLIPARRHKKRRIQKKWIKRYGYKTIYIKKKIEDLSLRHVGDCDYEFYKEM